MMSSTTLIVLLLVLYFCVLFIELRRFSRPLESCVQPTTTTTTTSIGKANATVQKVGSKRQKPCFHPLVQPQDELHLDLWTFADVNISTCVNTLSSQSCTSDGLKVRSQWARIKTCSSIPILPLSVLSNIVKYENCTFSLPSDSRLRGLENGSPLRALFVLRRGDLIVAEAPFELTRMVKIYVLNNINNTNDGNKYKRSGEVLLAPHYKYQKQRVVLRLVQEYRDYATLVRGDGTRLQQHFGSCTHDGSVAICYRPILYVDDTALLFSSQIQMASQGEAKSDALVKLNVKVSLVSPLKDVVVRHVAEGVKMAGTILHEEEIDEIRWFLSDENVYRFLLTQIISFTHLALDCFAFRDEVKFYVGRTDMGGLSMSSVVTRFLCSLIILLYLYDGRKTSYIVLFSVFLGVVADGWKMSKVLKPSLSAEFPFVHFRDASRLSLAEHETAKYDSIARIYLGLLFYPLILGTAIYAKKHYQYESTWSWAISNAANAVYTFGFIALCPQLYINYRLKSVSHLPWKVFMYKIFNTFIDDVFAFLIEMPLKHKLMTLRDDAIFLGFLFQCYIYRVDKSRCNEFGYAYDIDESAVTKTAVNEITNEEEKKDEGLTSASLNGEPKSETTKEQDVSKL